MSIWPLSQGEGTGEPSPVSERNGEQPYGFTVYLFAFHYHQEVNLILSPPLTHQTKSLVFLGT